MLLFLTGCGPLIVPHPAPTSVGLDDQPLDRGQGELGVGLTAAYPLSAGRLIGDPGLFGGWYQLRVGAGVFDKWTVRGQMTQNVLSPVYGAEVQRRLLDGDRLGVTATVGMATSRFDSAYTPRDADGVEGDPIHYGYRVYAPSVGATTSWRLFDELSLTGRARVTGSTANHEYGLTGADTWWWGQVGSSVVWEPGPVAFAAGVQAHGTDLQVAWLTPSLAVAWRPSVTAR